MLNVTVCRRAMLIAVVGFAVLATLPATAASGKKICAPAIHLDVPVTWNLPYSMARDALIKAGWQPVLFSPPPQLPAAHADFESKGYAELVDCSGAELGQCTFAFDDIYRNRLLVETAGEDADPHVIKSYFSCD